MGWGRLGYLVGAVLFHHSIPIRVHIQGDPCGDRAASAPGTARGSGAKPPDPADLGLLSPSLFQARGDRDGLLELRTHRRR